MVAGDGGNEKRRKRNRNVTRTWKINFPSEITVADEMKWDQTVKELLDLVIRGMGC